MNKLLPLLALFSATVITGCSSGTQQQSNPLGYYFSLLQYSPNVTTTTAKTNKVSLIQDTNGQFSFNTTESYQLTALNINFYSDSACSQLGQSLNIPGYQTLQPGTYSVTDQSNYYVCSTLYPGGCDGLFNALGTGVKSVQFQFIFNNNASYKTACLYNQNLGYEGFANYETTPTTACQNSESCGLSQSYPTSNLPQVVNQSWQKIPTMTGTSPIAYAAIDQGGQVFAVQQSTREQSVFDCGYDHYCYYIYNNANGNFTNQVAHVSDPVSAFAAGVSNYIYWGSKAFIGGNFDGYSIGADSPSSLYTLHAYYPTTAYYYNIPPYDGIYWGDTAGDLYLNGSQINSFGSSLYPNNAYGGVKSITFDTSGNLWWGAVGQLGDTNIFICPSYGTGNCTSPVPVTLPLASDSTYTGINVSADPSGNVYAGFGSGGLLYKYSSTTASATLLYQPIAGALSNSNFVGINTNVIYDAYHDQIWYSTALTQSFLSGSQILGFDQYGYLANWQLPPVPNETTAPTQIMIFTGPNENPATGTVYAVYPDGVYYIQYANQG